MGIMDYGLVTTPLVAVDGLGDVFSFVPGSPVEVIRWGLIADALIDVGAGMTVKADKVNSAGTRGDGDAGSVTTTSDIAAEDGIYTENVSPGVTAHPTEPHKLIPGERIVFQVTDIADTAGDAFIFIEYRKRPFVGDDLANMTKVTS